MQLDKQKALEAIVYIAERFSEPSVFYINKICFLADKYHLEHYGRFMFWDSYLALKHGPVPAYVYNLMKAVQEQKNKPLATVEEAGGAFFIDDAEGTPYVIPYRAADVEEFSETDEEALQYALALCEGKSFSDLSMATHDQVWEKAYLSPEKKIDVLDITTTLKNGKTIAAFLQGLYQ